MRRTLAGLLFGLAYTCASISVAGFLMQRTAFDPDNSADAAEVVLGDDAIKQELVDIIVDSTAATLTDGSPESIAVLRSTVTSVAEHPEGQELLAEIIHDAHAHLIGEQSEPVQITGEQMVPIVRNEAVATLPAVTLPVPRVSALAFARTVVGWLVPLAALATLVLVALGFASHPDRAALLKSLAFGLLLLAALTALLGYLIPKLIIPLLSASPWANIPARLADDSLPLLIGMEVVLVGGALALFAGSGMARKNKRWSTPVSTYRYNEERRWSG